MSTSRSEALARARLYLCTDSRRERGDLAEFCEAVLAAGVDIIQLREKNLEAVDELEALAVLADACRRHGRLLAVNDRADLAVAAGADVLHLGQRDLDPAVARRIVGPDVLIGLSSHSTAQARAAAAAAEVDYFCLGPIWATPTKPGRPHTGLAPLAELAAERPAKPWFGIGGIDETTLDQVLGAGARRAVVVRVLTEAADPAAVTARLAERLAAAG
ncbi:thiamine phosphate synthase [Jatrophihabitans sp.]|uniref:thiamine phosphate synthase n=1 Tax=Jatrophihabitans sp. TaxID=1932789 RepID=UPI002CD45246|nr:thiamine phosphate synthase [Jatrophihabitans sp.]